MRVRVFITAAVCICITATSAWSSPKAIGDSGGIKGVHLSQTGGATSGGGTATPHVKKLSPKAGAACFRACMHGVDSSWGNFCDYSCYGP
jgi:hypothetical protein